MLNVDSENAANRELCSAHSASFHVTFCVCGVKLSVDHRLTACNRGLKERCILTEQLEVQSLFLATDRHYAFNSDSIVGIYSLCMYSV